MKKTIGSVANLLLLALALGVTLQSAGEAVAAPRGAAAVGGERKVLGDLELRTPSGKQVSLIPLVGSQAIVVVFWASWAPECRKEVPRLNGLDADRLIKVIAVNAGESPGQIEKFAKQHEVSYDVVLDPKGAVAKAFQVSGVPSVVIISRSGLIVYRGSRLPEEIEYYVAQ